MNLNKMVSSAIRILQKIRDVSARATHLEAANKKYLLTTNERKQMSTTTNFKRIALVAVAALGLGVLSSVPSQAAVSGLTVAVVNGTSTSAKSDSTTAATINISGFVGANDTIVAYVVAKSIPSTAGAVTPVFYNLDSATPLLATQVVDSGTGSPVAVFKTWKVATDSVIATTGSTGGFRLASSSDANINHKFGFQLDSSSATRAAGTYTYTLVVKTYEAGQSNPFTTTTKDVSITVAALSTESAIASATTSTAYIALSGTPSADVSVSLPGTASSTYGALVYVTLLNAASGSTAVKDSLTVTIDKGNVGTSGSAAMGKSILVAYAGSALPIYIFADGSTGTSTITIATKNAGTFTKTLTFYGTDYKSIVASSYRSVINIGLETGVAGAAAKGAIKVNAYDANQTSFGSATTVYAYSSDTSVISDYGTACGDWNTTDLAAYCRLTGVKAGTATITLRDAATVAASTVSSNAVSVRVSASSATSVGNTFTLTTDKASYAPGEKGYLIVTVKDASGVIGPITTAATVFASGGITNTAQLGNSSDVLTGLTITSDRSSTPSSTDPIKVYTFYAPVSAGTVTFSAKGASTFSAASQATATTVTITVADSASAALAAVSALAVTVASLKTLITTLTNLVLKIQKKVKA
jgi:hypothetical protein